MLVWPSFRKLNFFWLKAELNIKKNKSVTYLAIPNLSFFFFFFKHYVASLFEASRFLIVTAKPGNIIEKVYWSYSFVSLTLIFWPFPSPLLPIFPPLPRLRSIILMWSVFCVLTLQDMVFALQFNDGLDNSSLFPLPHPTL